MSDKTVVNNVVNNHGVGFFGLLAVVFITLKLLGYIGWSWWWVTAPLWAPIAVVLAIALSALLFAGVTYSIICLCECCVKKDKRKK